MSDFPWIPELILAGIEIGVLSVVAFAWTRFRNPFRAVDAELRSLHSRAVQTANNLLVELEGDTQDDDRQRPAIGMIDSYRNEFRYSENERRIQERLQRYTDILKDDLTSFISVGQFVPRLSTEKQLRSGNLNEKLRYASALRASLQGWHSGKIESKRTKAVFDDARNFVANPILRVR